MRNIKADNNKHFCIRYKDLSAIYEAVIAFIAVLGVLLLVIAGIAAGNTVVVYAGEKNIYVNPDSGYEALIEDDAELIAEADYEKLLDVMKQITVYGNVMLKTINSNTTSTESYVRRLYNQKYGSDSGTIFIIDMDNRNIWIHSNGKIYSTITSSYADTITDNVYRYA